MKLLESLKALFQIGAGKSMSEDVETTQPATPPILFSKNDRGEVIKVNLNEDEKKILLNFTKSSFFDSLFIIFNQILNEGTIYSNDVNKIDDFIIDWQVEHPDESLPRPLQFIQAALLPKLNNMYTEPDAIITQQQQSNTPQQPMRAMVEEPEVVFEGNELPSYLGRINDMIEKEVRRRVKIEMRDYATLKNDYIILKKKFSDIQKVFGARE